MADQTVGYTVNRRQLLPALLKEFFVLADAAQGKPSFQLTDLSALPAAQLAQIVPVVNATFEIIVEDGYLCSLHRRTGQRQQHFLLEPANIFVFNQFNGNTTLAEAGHRLAAELGWETPTAVAYSNALFLALAHYQLCLPRDPCLPSAEEGAP